MSKLAERMAKKIKRDLDIDVVPEIIRNYGAYPFRSDGINLWHMKEVDSNGIGYGIGSNYRVRDCLNPKYRLRVGLADLSGSQIELEEIK